MLLTQSTVKCRDLKTCYVVPKHNLVEFNKMMQMSEFEGTVFDIILMQLHFSW